MSARKMWGHQGHLWKGISPGINVKLGSPSCLPGAAGWPGAQGSGKLWWPLGGSAGLVPTPAGHLVFLHHAMAAQAQEGLEELSHAEGQEGSFTLIKTPPDQPEHA